MIFGDRRQRPERHADLYPDWSQQDGVLVTGEVVYIRSVAAEFPFRKVEHDSESWLLELARCANGVVVAKAATGFVAATSSRLSK